MGEVVELKPAALIDNLEFIRDMCRFQEGIASEKAIRKKYRLADEVWEKLNDDELVRAIEEESVRRIRCGDTKREKAQQLVVKAPDVLSDILNDTAQSARHRIDSAKVLNDFAANGPAGVPASDRFIITINLGSDTLRFNKSIECNAGDIDPYHPDDADPQGWLLAAAAKSRSQEGGGGGENPL
jgi:hypothetical protein